MSAKTARKARKQAQQADKAQYDLLLREGEKLFYATRDANLVNRPSALPSDKESIQLLYDYVRDSHTLARKLGITPRNSTELFSIEFATLALLICIFTDAPVEAFNYPGLQQGDFLATFLCFQVEYLDRTPGICRVLDEVSQILSAYAVGRQAKQTFAPNLKAVVTFV